MGIVGERIGDVFGKWILERGRDSKGMIRRGIKVMRNGMGREKGGWGGIRV